MAGNAQHEPRPRLACEITPLRVVAARAGKGQMIASCTVRALPAGAVAPSLTAGNLTNAAALRETIREAFSTVGSHGRDVIIILPDSCCRVSLIDLDTLPAKRRDAEAVVRFRMKKALPFDVDKARVSFQAQPASNGTVRVLATVALASVLDEYEAAVRDAGYVPGVVLPATLAALGGVDAATATLLIHVGAQSLTVAGVDKEQLLLFRTLENPLGVEVSGEQIADDVHASAVFFEDTYGTKIRRILVSGVATERVADALEAQTGVKPQDLLLSSQLGDAAISAPHALLGPVVGALTS